MISSTISAEHYDVLRFYSEVVFNCVSELLHEFKDDRSMISAFVEQFPRSKAMALRYRTALQRRSILVDVCLSWSLKYELELITFLNHLLSVPDLRQELQACGKLNSFIQNIPIIGDAARDQGMQCKILRIMCGFAFYFAYSLSPEVRKNLVQFQPSDSERVKNLKIALFIILMPKNCIPGTEQWLNLKLELELKFKTTSAFSQSLTLSLFSNRIESFHGTISDLLNMHPILFTSEKYLMIKQMTAEVFPQSKITDLCMLLLKNGSTISPITLDLFLFLMQANVFTNINMAELGSREVVRKCIEYNPVIPIILQTALKGRYSSIPADYIISVFETKPKLEFEHLLLAYYVFCSFKFLETNLQYRRDILNHLKIWDLLHYAKTHHSEIYPDFASLAVLISPVYFDVSATLLDLEQAEKKYLTNLRSLTKATAHEVKLLELIYSKSSDFDIICDYLNAKTGSEKYFCKYWKYYLYAKNPQKACLATIEVLSDSLAAELVIIDPVKLLQTLLPLLNQEEYTDIYFLVIQFASCSFKSISPYILDDKKPLKTSANLLFDSIIVQNLLLIASTSQSSISLSIYRFIHQFFVDNTTVLRLVHFQGYKLELVQSAVKYIPSLCNYIRLTLDATIDFLPELLTSQKRLSFGMAIGVALCKEYPVSRT